METTATTTAPSGSGIFINESMADSGSGAGSGSGSGGVGIGIGSGAHAQASSQMAKLRRDSIAHSQGIGGVSWGSLTISSWLRDEVIIHAQSSAKDHVLTDSININNSSSGTAAAGSGTASAAKSIPINTGTPYTGGIGTGQKSPLDLTKFASPPGSSGAYLPNLEKQYCKDYSCCGQLLPSLHDLLRHYEEAHISTSPGNHSHSHYHHSSNHFHNDHSHSHSHSSHAMNSNALDVDLDFNLHNNSAHDATFTHSNLHSHLHQNPSSSNINGHPYSDADPLHPMQYEQLSNAGNGVHYQQNKTNGTYNNSSPRKKSDPRSSQGKQNRKPKLNSVSSNTNLNSLAQSGQISASTSQLHLNGGFVDAVSTNDVFLQSKHTQNSNSTSRTIQNFNSYSMKSQQSMAQPLGKRPSAPLGSVGLDLDYMDSGVLSGLNDISLDGGIMGYGMDHLTNNVPLSNTNQIGLSKNGKKLSTSHLKNKTMNGRDTMPAFPGHHTSAVVLDDEDEEDEDIIDDDEDDENDDEEETVSSGRKQQGYIDDPARRLYVMDHEEHKPFKCPVIGCDKAYKNQNGLKYHRLHGHRGQKLHENPDGTFSVIDPESNEPYPDGMGIENDKPYRCEVCGKRYKNLNGLKYHRGHSTH